MFLHLSVILSTGGGSVSVHAGMPPRDQAHPPQVQTTPQDQAPPQHPPPRETAAAADGTHPIGMHSCSEINYAIFIKYSVCYLFMIRVLLQYAIRFNKMK